MRNEIERACMAVLLIAALASLGAAQVTQRVNVDSSGAQATGGNSAGAAISADGRYVGFWSNTTDLVALDTNSRYDVFVRDRQLGVTELASVDSAGAQGNAASGSPRLALSGDGRCIAFVSVATNLVAGDTNGLADVFLRDRQLGLTERLSLSSAGAQPNNWCGDPSISSDGRYVAFVCHATNLVPGDTNVTGDVLVRDRQLGLTERVSVDSSGAQGNSYSAGASISSTGRYVAFWSYASNLVAGDTNGQADVFVRDRQLGLTGVVSIDGASAYGNDDSGMRGLSISADGRYVAFWSRATNLVPSDTNGREDIFVRDRQLAATERVSVDSAGAQADHLNEYPSISADGRYVAFESDATNLVPGDTNASSDVFRRDRLLGLTERLSVGAAALQGNSWSDGASISADGRAVAFTSDATNLVPGDTNARDDVFVRDLGPVVPVVYCTAGTTTHGCLAAISGTGTPSASAGSGFTLSASSIEGQKLGLFFYGVDNSGFTPSPWGQGTSWLCVKPPTQRTPILVSGGTANLCDGTFALDWNAYIAANAGALGNPFSAGQHVFAQTWFRDPPAPKTTNLSNALEFVVEP